MRIFGGLRLRVAVALGCGLAAALTTGPAAAQAEKTYVMKLSTATINDSQHEWMKMFVAAVEKDSGGRIKGEIYPASQLGTIPRQIEGTQFGSIQGWIGPPEFLVGVDDRFEVLSAPGLFTEMKQADRTIKDPEFKQVILSMGGNKGLIGIALFISAPSAFNTRTPVRHLADLKGKKIRVLASPFQNEQVTRLGGTPVALSLGDVLPAIQQGAIDGAVSTVPVFAAFKYYDAAKYMTETGHSYVFSVSEISKKWYDSLPPDLQKIIIDEGEKMGNAITPWQFDFYDRGRKDWVDKGGELLALPPQEQAAMMESLASVGEDLSKNKPPLKAAYEALVAAVNRNK
jgi:TRAP-type transport system periplasmic protein